MYEATEVDKLVFRYQAGEDGAAEALLAQYGFIYGETPTRFLGKYYQMLVHGAYDLRDKDTRRFLQLYMGDKEARRIMTYHLQGSDTKRLAAQVASNLMGHVQKMDKEDLIQDLVVVFLEQARKYKKKKKNVDFSGYLYNSFRYGLYHLLGKRLFGFDVLNHPHLEELDEDLIGEGAIEIKEEWFYEEPLLKDEPELGLDWVQGRCCSVFDQLSTLERLILKLAYDKNMTDEQIAKQLGFHRNTIWKYRNEAKGAVEDRYEVLRNEGAFE